METKNLAYASFDDIVFEGRNHAYGAYLLRKLYTRNLYTGLIIAISLFILFLSIPVITNLLFSRQYIVAPKPKPTTTTITDIVVPKIIPPVVKPEELKPVQQKIKQTKFNEFVIKENVLKPVTIPTQEDLSKTNIGTTTITEGTDKPAVAIDNPGNKITEAPATAEIFNSVQVMPAFPGGDAALFKYLGQHIEYPALARRMGLTGQVVLQFVVDEQGEISDIKVLRSVGGGIDEEAIRVVKGMPRWSPGLQNGRPVKVRFVVPVRFAIR